MAFAETVQDNTKSCIRRVTTVKIINIIEKNRSLLLFIPDCQ